MVLLGLLHVLAHVGLRRPRVYQRLLVVRGLLAFAVAACLRLGELLAGQLPVPELGCGCLVLVARVLARVQVSGLLLPLLRKLGALLLARSTSFLAARRIVLQIGVLDLSLVGCGPLLLRLPLTRMVPLLAAGLLLVQQLYLFLLLLGFLLLLQLLLEDLLLLVLELPLSFLPVQNGVAHHLGAEEVNSVIAHEVLDGVAAVVDLAELDEERDQVEELLVLHVIVPGDDWDRLLGLEHVGRWRVVEDDCILRISANLAHVFREHTLHVGAVLTEQASRAKAIGVHLVHEWVGVLRETRGEDDHLEVLCHYAEEIVDAGPLLHKDLARVAVDVHGNDKVRILDLVELTVHKCFVQVQHECLHSFVSLGRWTQQSPAGLFLSLVVASVGTRWYFDVATLRFRSVFWGVLLIHHWHWIYLSLRDLRHHGL